MMTKDNYCAFADLLLLHQSESTFRRWIGQSSPASHRNLSLRIELKALQRMAEVAVEEEEAVGEEAVGEEVEELEGGLGIVVPAVEAAVEGAEGEEEEAAAVEGEAEAAAVEEGEAEVEGAVAEGEEAEEEAAAGEAAEERMAEGLRISDSRSRTFS
ncbi:hypothetical protein niasHS_002169 [Heterodera schachtii]|uniref:Uncharacterized protein n=1 Tax=Heterodera schachtii TaxID=97005 RepID=A0ABD2KN39_HETSC